MICRCQKTGIGGKPGDHRTIYKACDVGMNKALTVIIDFNVNAVLHYLHITIQVVLHSQKTNISALFYQHLRHHE